MSDEELKYQGKLLSRTVSLLCAGNPNMFYRGYKHNKTGKTYFQLFLPCFGQEAIECTNGREDKLYVLYTDGVHLFCREREEFNQKFTAI